MCDGKRVCVRVSVCVRARVCEGERVLGRDYASVIFIFLFILLKNGIPKMYACVYT